MAFPGTSSNCPRFESSETTCFQRIKHFKHANKNTSQGIKGFHSLQNPPTSTLTMMSSWALTVEKDELLFLEPWRGGGGMIFTGNNTEHSTFGPEAHQTFLYFLHNETLTKQTSDDAILWALQLVTLDVLNAQGFGSLKKSDKPPDVTLVIHIQAPWRQTFQTVHTLQAKPWSLQPDVTSGKFQTQTKNPPPKKNKPMRYISPKIMNGLNCCF